MSGRDYRVMAFLSNEAGVEFGLKGLSVEIVADEDDLLAAISVRTFPFAFDLWGELRAIDASLFEGSGPPIADEIAASGGR